MRITLFLVALFLQGAPAQESDAEKLFKKMEERLVNAKTLQFSVKATSDRSEQDTTVAKFQLGEGNRLRVDYQMGSGGPENTTVFVSDGKELKQKRQEQSWGPWKMAADLNAVAKIGTARLGGGFFLQFYRLETRDAATKALPVSGFKSGGKEKIGEVETEIVEYTVEHAERGRMTIKVWIDPLQALPLRQTLTGEFQGKKVVATSVYEGFKIDEKIAEEKFKLPKFEPRSGYHPSMKYIAFLLLLVPPAQESDAEKLFKKMEEKITTAKTLLFTAKTEVAKESAEESTYMLGEGNRLAIQFRITRGGSTTEGRVVSDGTSIKERKLEKTPADLGAIVRIAVARMTIGTLAGMIKLKKEEVSKKLTPSEFKSGGKEKIGDVEAEIVDYSVTVPMAGKCALRVWIDPKTLLPLKRTATMPQEEGDPMKVTTIYEGFKVDEKIDESKFKLP